MRHNFINRLLNPVETRQEGLSVVLEHKIV